MRLRVGPFVIANGDAISNVVTLTEDPDYKHMALSGIECPAAVSSASASIEYSRDGSTYYNVRPLGSTDAIPIASADSNSVNCFSPVAPGYYYSLGSRLRIRTSGNEGAERTFYLVFNSVS